LAITNGGARFNTPAVFGGALYLLMPATLWFHSNTYYVEIFVQLPFIVSVYLAILYEKNTHGVSNRRLVILALLGISLTITVLSEWLGVVLSGTLFFHALMRRCPRRDVKLLLVSGLAPVIGVGIFIAQHSLIVGFEDFMRHLVRQLLFQIGVTGPTVIIPEAFQGIDLKRILHHYYRGFAPALVLIVFTFVLAIPKLRSSDWRDRFSLALLLTLGPVVIHHVLLPRFTSVHWYSVLKGSYFLILIISAFLYVIWSGSNNMKLYYSGLLITLLMLVPVTYSKYQVYAGVGDRGYYQRVAHPIRSLAREDEVAFLVRKIPVFAQMIYYAQRNVQVIDSVEGAKRWLMNSNTNVRKGIVFDRLGSYKFKRIEVDR
jgi:hypothetical protein